MTRRFRRFSATALVGTVIVAGALALAYRDIAVDNLTEMRGEQSVEIARSLSNSLVDDVQAIIDAAAGSDWADIHGSAAVAAIAESIRNETNNLTVFKVNIFAPDGLVLYSTQSRMIGSYLMANDAIVAAASGNEISSIVRRDTFNEYDRVIEQRDLIESYVPLRTQAGDIIGVFEVYSDITPLVARISDTQMSIVASVFGIMGAFYLLLVGLYGRTDRRLESEMAASKRHLQEVEAANKGLEARVAERTKYLQRERDLMQRAIDGLKDPAIIADRDFNVTLMNRAAREAYGVSGEDANPPPCFQLLHGQDTPCESVDAPCALMTGEACKKVVDHADGGITEIRTTPLIDESGEVAGVVKVVHDLNEHERKALKWRQARDEAETASRAKSEFVATISHEIRTPMNAVLGMADLLNLTDLTRKQREYVQTIQSSGDMLLSLVDNVLDFSHLEYGALRLQSAEFRVADLLERVLQVMGYSAYSKNLELIGTLHIDPELRIRADNRRLRQILVNVVNNAVKFTDSGDVVVDVSVISSTENELTLRVVVSDTGVGIGDSQIDDLIEPFESGARPESAQRYGSGLGLTISKRLLDAMGGRIDIEPRDGGGTIVTIDVPVSRVPVPERFDPGSEYQRWPKRVLSLHSHPVAARSICTSLQSWGIGCEAVTGVDEAVNRLSAASADDEPFDCAIVDSSICDDRLFFVRHVRSQEKISDLPIILLTSIAETLTIGKVSALGSVRCVNKPVLPSELRYNLIRIVQDGESPGDIQDRRLDVVDVGEALRILIAEDNPVSSGVLRSMLLSEGYAPQVVEDGPAVLELLRREKFDLLLLDCQMPGIDGDVVTREIRGKPEVYGSGSVIVAVTADTTDRHRAKCLDAGMDDFVAKPIRLEKLRRGLRNWSVLAAKRRADEPDLAHRILRRSLIEKTGREDESFLNDYIGLFLQDAQIRLEKMGRAIQNLDSVSARREGHALKGSCLELGADRMARFCDDLSAAAKKDNLDEAGAILEKLDREFTRLRPVYESAKSGMH